MQQVAPPLDLQILPELFLHSVDANGDVVAPGAEVVGIGDEIHAIHGADATTAPAFSAQARPSIPRCSTDEIARIPGVVIRAGATNQDPRLSPWDLNEFITGLELRVTDERGKRLREVVADGGELA